jgi:acyl-CoA synthetase (AMP-forming)/AMP-acid ligase II
MPPADANSADKPGTVGWCVAGAELRIVDPASGAELGAGEPGELWFRGPNVMKGYLHNPEATAATISDDGWCRTGDIGQVDADGFVQIVDRLKELIKYKGYHVAPAELEAVLISHPLIADAAVVASPDEEAGEVPKAILVVKEEQATDRERRRQRGHGLCGRTGGARQAGAPLRVRRGDPPDAVRQDRPTGAHRARALGCPREPRLSRFTPPSLWSALVALRSGASAT